MNNPTSGNGSSLNPARRLMLLTTTTGYETRQFVEAAGKIGATVVFGSDRCHRLDDPWQDGALPLKFEKPDAAARAIIEYGRAHPLDGVVALGDCTPPAAARACRELGLLYHTPEAADICRDKHCSRQRLASSGLNVPAFVRYPLGADPEEIAPAGPPVGFPCVLKPLALSASRGVIRADNREQFVSAFRRIGALLRSRDVRAMRQETSGFIQVEAYLEGDEFAVEGVVERGRMKVLAIFDKPDPLRGPFFPETIYVTPSRLDARTQVKVEACLGSAVEALGLYHGPLHAELRINTQGVWLLEVAARSIGGLCARALRFTTHGSCQAMPLEEMLIRLALGENIQAIEREPVASGVMMIPVIEEGILEEVQGMDEARATPGVEEIIITARPPEKLVPWPEGSSYPGFIFARGPSPEFVEQALRLAHGKLRFVLSPALPVIHSH